MDVYARKALLLLGDVALLYVALFLSLFIRYGSAFNHELFSVHIIPFTGLYFIWLILFYVFNLYDLHMTHTARGILVSHQLLAMPFMFFAGVTFFYVVPLQTISPKTNLIIHIVLFGILATFWRLYFFYKSRSKIFWRVGLVSTDPYAAELSSLISSHQHLGYQPIMLHSFDQFTQTFLDLRLNLFVLPSNTRTDVTQTQRLYQCLGKGVTFLEPTVAFEFFARRVPLSAVDHYWFLRHVQDREHGFSRFVKRGFDIIAASCLLFISLPFWLLIYIAIKLEDGSPIFYRQKRVGKGRNVFDVLKFRTMRTDAEANGAMWAVKNDSRVTSLGKILRCTHLDELPQMINVLRGDISLVGPRPERPEFVTQLENQIPHYHVRHFIKPGFTGWAQIRYRYARSVADSQTKFEYDLYYIKNQSLVLDILILLKTAQLLFRKEE